MFCGAQLVWLRGLMRGNIAGQRELKRYTRPGVGGGPQTATVRLDDGAADGQSHAGAVRLGRKERIEDLLCLLRR